MQEAERQAGLDTILAALAQKGAQEAALAKELAALRGQEQVGNAGATGQPTWCHHLCTAAMSGCHWQAVSSRRLTLTLTSPCSKCLPTSAVVCRVQHRLEIWRPPCGSMLPLRIGGQGRGCHVSVSPGPAHCPHAGLALLQAIKDRRVEREGEYAAQREAEFQASLDAEAAAQRDLRDRYSADAAQQVHEYRRQQEERQAAKQAAHEDMARDMAWQVTEQGAASQGR